MNRALITNPNLQRVWLAQICSVFGDMLTFLALPLLVYEATQSKAALSFAIFARVLPTLCMGLIAGALADRWCRRTVMVVTNTLQALVTIPILFVPSNSLVITIYVTVACKAVIGAFSQPAMSSTIPTLVERKQLMSFNAVMTLSYRTLQFLAPLFGAWLLTASGPRVLLIVDILSFLIAALLLHRTAIPAHEPQDPTERKDLRAGIQAGLRHIATTPVLRGIILSSMVIMLGQGFISPVWLPYIVEVLQKPAEHFGILVSLQGLGFVLGSLLVLALGLRKRPQTKRWYIFFILSGGITIFLQVTTYNFSLFLVWATLAGIFLAGRDVATITLIQHSAPQHLMGRVSSTNHLLTQTAMMVAVLIVGGFGEQIGTRLLFVVATSIYLLGSTLGAVFMAPLPEPELEETRI